MNRSKSIWMSKTFWGAAVAGFAAIASIFGKNISPELQGSITETVLSLISVGGAILAAWGRKVADTKIK